MQCFKFLCILANGAQNHYGMMQYYFDGAIAEVEIRSNRVEILNQLLRFFYIRVCKEAS
jgi:hypothetical protein